MLQGRDIIYMAGHDYGLNDSRISTDHLAHHLAAANRVLYVESVGLRTPRLDANDLSRIRRKLARFLRQPRRMDERLWVMTPFAVPLHHNRLVDALNRTLLTTQIRRSAAYLGFEAPIAFVFLPSMGSVIGRLGESVSVYYCTDEHAAFPDVDSEFIRRSEEALLRRVDVVFGTSREIVRNKSRLHSNVHYSPHGVDFDPFARAQDADLATPSDVAGLTHPIVGYFGAIDTWLDLELIEALARERPEWNFLLIGKQAVDTSGLSALPNVTFLGARPFAELPAYGRLFDVALIPFRISDLTNSVEPVKLREYLAMGKPVVSTALPSIVDIAAETGLVSCARDRTEFLALVESALASDSPELIAARQDSVRPHSWKRRTARVGETIERFIATRRDI